MTIELPAGQVLTVTADKFSAGNVQRLGQPGTEPNYAVAAVEVSTSLVIGPFTASRIYDIRSTSNLLTYALSQPNEVEPLVESPRTLFIQPTTIPLGVTQTIPELSQALVFGALTVLGRLTVLGNLRVPSLPAS